jgi:hypothetical protein
VPRIVERVDRERLRKEGDKLFEYIELGSERMKQEEVGARPSLDVADSVASEELEPSESISALRRLIASLGPEQSGKFFNHTGREYPW